MMFGFQKAKEIHMDQVRDKSKQNRRVTPIEGRTQQDGQPRGLRVNQTSPYTSKVSQHHLNLRSVAQKDGRGKSVSESMSPQTATTPLRHISLHRVSANQKSRSFISPSNSNNAHENENLSSPVTNKIGRPAFNQRDASAGAANGMRKLLFMKSEESTMPGGLPTLINQNRPTASPAKIVHF